MINEQVFEDLKRRASKIGFEVKADPFLPDRAGLFGPDLEMRAATFEAIDARLTSEARAAFRRKLRAERAAVAVPRGARPARV